MASSYIKTVNIFWLTLAPIKHFIVNFSKSYPFKGPRAGYVCLFWLDSSCSHWVDAEPDSSSTKSTQNETPCQLSHIKWDSTSTESTQNTPKFTKILSLCIDSVDVESHSALTQLKCSLTWCWLSWWGMRLCINWVTAECLKIRKSWRILEQNRKIQKPYYLAYMCSISAKREQKISCKCTFKENQKGGNDNKKLYQK